MIGEQPTFTPGHLHQYSSCTMFDNEEYCQMEGYFLMKYLDRGEQGSVRYSGSSLFT